MLPIIRTPRAEQDVEEILAYLEQYSPAAADRLVDDLEQRCRPLSHSPKMGRARDELAPGLRSLPVGNYMVFYRVTDSAVEIVRIVHGARNLKQLFKDSDAD